MRKALLLILIASCPATAGAASYSISTSGSLSSGRFGGTDETRVASSTIGVRTQIKDWELGVTLPYLAIDSGASGALSIDGAIIGGAEIRRGRQSGYGDVTLRVSRQLPIGQDFPVQARLTAHAKLPTGARSLSTGKLDTGVGVELSRSFGNVTPYLSASYRTFGDMRMVRLRDGWATSAGVMASFGRVTLVASHESSQALVGGAGSRELFAAATGPLAPGWAWTLFGSKGYSAGAPNLMVGTSITRSFGSR
ncbi:MAG TPA: hypothetical protein VF631_03190 [Allosphingosinicella sp.]|jgi:hypothetical protein|uniref:hypothetical protein n=1 Tax=Allosphingosinicella sp. TaxID=2823234 RepID=UPI002F28CA71